MDRVERLMTIPAVGRYRVDWALEVGDAQRFSSIKKAISYCGLLVGEEFRNTVHARAVETAQQTLTIHADRGGKDGAALQPNLAMLYDKEKQKGNANRATLRWHGSWWPTSWRRPWSAEFSGGGNELHRCVKRGGEQEDFFDA